MVPTPKLNDRHQMWLSRFFLYKVTKHLHMSQSQFLFVILLSSKLKDNSAITFEDRLVLSIKYQLNVLFPRDLLVVTWSDLEICFVSRKCNLC